MNCFKKNNKKKFKTEERCEEDEPLIEIVNEISEKVSLDLNEIIKVRFNFKKNMNQFKRFNIKQIKFKFRI